MPLWNSSKKEPETVTMDKASGSKPLCPDGSGGETRDIRRAYEFKEVLGTYVSLGCCAVFLFSLILFSVLRTESDLCEIALQ